MIFEIVFDFMFNCLTAFLDTITIGFTIPPWLGNFTNLLLKGLAFFPFEVWSVILADGFLMMGVHFAWAVIEWIYIKIPGVN